LSRRGSVLEGIEFKGMDATPQYHAAQLAQRNRELDLQEKQMKKKPATTMMHPFKEGDWILVERDGKCKTGTKKREGPFQVTAVSQTTVTYASPKFEGRQLTVAVGRVSKFSIRPGSNPYRESLEEDSDRFVVDDIVGHRIVGSKKDKTKTPRLNNTQVRVKWEGYDELSWEPLTNRTIRRLEVFREYAQKHPELAHLIPK